MSYQPSLPPIFPPISQVMTRNNCLDVLDQLGTYLKTKNADGMKHIGNILSKMCLDHITAAFLKWVEQKSICQNCGKQLLQHPPDRAYRFPPPIIRPHKSKGGGALINFFPVAGKDENVNYYELLGDDERATADQIKKAYRERMRGYQPGQRNPYGEAMPRGIQKYAHAYFFPEFGMT
ncbi:hypothetical protein GPALN_010691 [Globodera pallida]|nr:hypothetical protein GPALN_010691 [Globodera pallida]